MRAPPTTVEIVEALALRDPARPALREETSELDYGQLHALLVQAGLWLQRQGLRRGDRVAVGGPGFGLQLVVLLAAEALGAVTASFQAEGDPDAPALFAQVQWVLCARPQAVPPGVRMHVLDAEFLRLLAQPLGGDRPAWLALEAHEPQRIARTSGSSGQSKLMVLGRRAQEYWISLGLTLQGTGVQLRLLMLAPLVINGAFTRSSACLRQGGMLLVGAGADIEQLAPTVVWGLPVQLERLLAGLPAGYVAPQPVAVASLGGLLAPELRVRLQAVFGGRIANRYGSNEAGAVCDDVDAQGVGVLAPGVEVRIEDEGGTELPPGREGVVVVRTPGMADGYLSQPEEVARAFRDGWFVTGDVGALVGWRRLQLAGRHDDLVNVGGIKLPAARIEAQVRQQPAIADCAVQAVLLEGGAVTLGVALVLAAGASREEAQGQLRQALRLSAPALVRVVFVPALPVMGTGKVDRMALLRMLQQAGPQSSGSS